VNSRAIFVEISIAAPLETVWTLTQDTDLHPRWDARFSRITRVAGLDSGGYRFRYELRLPFHTIAGTGTSIGERRRADGTSTSALRFDTADRLSPLGAGRGYWRYAPQANGTTTFTTGYDYEPQWGVILDRLFVRAFIGWMTAFSFDRLRIWAETGVEPERWPLSSALWLWRSDRPRASRCRRRAGRPPLHDAPASLDTLEAP